MKHSNYRRAILVNAVAILFIGLAWLVFANRPYKPEIQTTSKEALAKPQAIKPGDKDQTLPSTGAGLAASGSKAPLFGVFETHLTNDKTYSNPYDFRVIELQATFTSPSGKKYSYFGFYDGDGNGGLNGNVWRLRFMPNETGAWTYTYTWTDSTPGGSGNFTVEDSGLPGPLRVARDRTWFFEDARGHPFHWRGYSLHRYLHWKYGRSIFSDAGWADLNDKIITKVAGRGYNAVMLRWPANTKSGDDFRGDNPGHHFWQQNGGQVDFSRFYIPQWKKVEETLQVAAEHKVYAFQFTALVDQLTDRPSQDEMIPYLRYMAARLGPYWNNFGYSATWEYTEIWSDETANSVMGQLYANLQGLPVPPLLSIHDHSDDLFSGWLGFSMRQGGGVSRDVFSLNCRVCGQHEGVGSIFKDLPVVGSEDIWEINESSDLPRNGTETRRMAWGMMMAGVLPVYKEDTGRSGVFAGEGEPEVRRMLDFFYTRTRYRQYEQLNHLVSKSAQQVASGIPGKEYLVYDQDGGSIKIDLSGISSAPAFSILLYDPKTGRRQCLGEIQGGASREIVSPYSGDTVLLLRQLSSSARPMSLTGDKPFSSPVGTRLHFPFSMRCD